MWCVGTAASVAPSSTPPRQQEARGEAGEAGEAR
ncbi:hypothetical protein E2C01_058482 [Portunus trituberculatus]|uniref:Uncharacterized protein n=1 Tax=Portunus trituberculatus TaxID=210409 RepID=A0A5B7H5I0_PORTR|nr:hypothetical protein [Portunus trituberculatus]